MYLPINLTDLNIYSNHLLIFMHLQISKRWRLNRHFPPRKCHSLKARKPKNGGPHPQAEEELKYRSSSSQKQTVGSFRISSGRVSQRSLSTLHTASAPRSTASWGGREGFCVCVCVVFSQVHNHFRTHPSLLSTFHSTFLLVPSSSVRLQDQAVPSL